ncbi:MAG: LysE family transporter [Sphingobacteriales bacterium]|nr:LysE family transporter [Sphingobacteriales bacterium]
MTEVLLKGVTIGLLLAFSVGPVIFTIIKQSISNGRAGGVSFVTGVWISDLLWVILSNVFSELVNELLHFERTIGLAGSGFLMGLGVYYLFFKKQVPRSEVETVINVTNSVHTKQVLSGFLINTLNPAVIAFWLTTATALAASNTVKERVVIFSVCLLLNMGADALKVILAGKLGNKLTDKNISFINKISGALLLGFGIVLLYNLFKH